MLLGDGARGGVHGDDREAHLQDPAVHDGTHRVRQTDGCLIVYSLGHSNPGWPSVQRPPPNLPTLRSLGRPPASLCKGHPAGRQEPGSQHQGWAS